MPATAASWGSDCKCLQPVRISDADVFMHLLASMTARLELLTCQQQQPLNGHASNRRPGV